MSEDKKVHPIKGFRSASTPTKGEVMQENATLVQQLQQNVAALDQRLRSVQQTYGNLLQQGMVRSRDQDQKLNSISSWLTASDATDGARTGDHLMLDFAGLLLNDDETPAMTTLVTPEGPKEVQNYFEVGGSKDVILTNLVSGQNFIPGFENQLLGLKAGEGKEIIVQFPAEYHAAELKGKKAKFTVFIHSVRRPLANSPVGDLVDANNDLRMQVQIKQAMDRQAEQQAAKDAAAKAKEAADAASQPPPADSGLTAPTPAQAPEGTPASTVVAASEPVAMEVAATSEEDAAAQVAAIDPTASTEAPATTQESAVAETASISGDNESGPVVSTAEPQAVSGNEESNPPGPPSS